MGAHYSVRRSRQAGLTCSCSASNHFDGMHFRAPIRRQPAASNRTEDEGMCPFTNECESTGIIRVSIPDLEIHLARQRLCCRTLIVDN